jgi:hypothetical protein
MSFTRSNWLIAMAIVGAVAPAHATTTNYTLTGGAATTQNYGTAIENTVALTNSGTGQKSLSGFTVDVGDSIDGTITLSTPMTVPAGNSGSELLIQLLGIGNSTPGTIYYNESLTFYNNGLEVAPPSQWTHFGGSGGVYSLGTTSTAPTPAFSFNEIVFDSTITSILGPSGSASSATLTTYSPELTVTGFTPVPLPAAAWLMLCGLSGIGALTRKKRADH